MHWEDGDPEKILLHALIGGIMADINGGKCGEGLTVAAINEILLGMLDKNKTELGLSKEAIAAISNIIGQAIGGNQGGAIAGSASKNNYLTHEQEKQRQKAIEEGDQEAIDFWNNLDKALDQFANVLFPGMSLEEIKVDPEKHKAVYETAIELKIPTIELPSSDVPYIIADTVAVAGMTYVIIKNGDTFYKALAPAAWYANQTANSVSDKLTRYLLNPSHPVGGLKQNGLNKL